MNRFEVSTIFLQLFVTCCIAISIFKCNSLYCQTTTKEVARDFISNFHETTFPLYYPVSRNIDIFDSLMKRGLSIDSTFLSSIITINNTFSLFEPTDEIGKFYLLDKVAFCDSLFLLIILENGIAGGWNYTLFGVITTPSLIHVDVVDIAGSSADCGGEIYTGCRIDSNLNIEKATKIYGGCDGKSGKLIDSYQSFYKINCTTLKFEPIIKSIKAKKKN